VVLLVSFFQNQKRQGVRKAKDSENQRVQGVQDSEKQRVQGVKESRGQVKKDRGLEGWRVGSLAKHLHL